MLMGFEEIDVADDDVREENPCPFCADYFDIVGLCCHIDDEHPVEAKNGVCPVCAVRAGVDMVAHITLQHGNIFKMQRKRKSRKVSSHSTLSLLRRELREGNLQSLFGGSSCIVPSSSAAPDPLLSSFILPMAEDYGNPRSHPSAAVVAVKKSTGEIAAERLIGDGVRLRKNGSDGKPPGIVHLKISSFRESKSDDKRFYIFTATKTLHLRTALKKERAAWIEALSSTRNLFQLRPLNDNVFPLPDVSISTERLKKRLRDEGISDGLVNDCEQIMLSEFSAVQGQLKFLWEERSNLLDTLRQFEASTGEAEASGVHDGEYQLIKNGYSSIGRAKYSVDLLWV